jgi:hypothetical protein
LENGMRFLCFAWFVVACSSHREDVVTPADAADPDAMAQGGDLHLDLHGGLQIYDHPEPFLGPSGLSTLIDVFRLVDGVAVAVADATVTLNGVPLPRNQRGSFTAATAPDLHISAGSRVELVAEAGASRLTYTFDCPDVAMTAPADGAAVRLGDPVIASWTGTVRNYEGSIDTAMVALYDYNSNTGNFSGATSFNIRQNLDGATQTVTLATPAAVDPGFDGLAVVLLAPGEPAPDAQKLAIEPYCDLTRRVILNVTP